nr:hypothetical protein [Armatimonas sp.]
MNTKTSFSLGLLLLGLLVPELARAQQILAPPVLQTSLLPGLVPAVWYLAHDFLIRLFQIIWGG